MGNQAAIRFEHVCKAFGEQRVLDDISFEVQAGEAFCILGRSGTGKSVTLKQLIRLIQPDDGKIFIEEEEITHMGAQDLSRVRQKMGFLFQSAALFDSITIGENVAFPLRRHTDHSEDQIQQIVQERLEEVGLADQASKMPTQLSGGMRKRAGLARALALGPSILLVDEPSSGLDPITSAEIDELLLELKVRKKTTMVVVTHNIPSARRIGDTLALLHQGHILQKGTAQQLQESGHELVREFMKAQGGT
ncbi:MAG: organic solvent resistance ABC transporter ATP-binding protein [Acidobacteria bacterium RIFCSPLOWO2_02_FULL_59_13]|nr:MAG: organic solvent resistance ABC transporter ATP-binding protein [Acidobacteria bacterium RIFCSPLOWO2_02_FULL_59_13]